ncbi:MAG: hypothetical protein NVSMB6_10460 [Burkholderiaceae bacterium]
MPNRSYEPLAIDDLRRLGELAGHDRRDLFRRKPETRGLYANRLFAVALCQGGALHYLDGINGIKDLDVWSFYRSNPLRQFPYRRRASVDFGDPKFGTTDDSPNFVGRRVDLIGRSIDAADYADPVEVLREYLRSGKTQSAQFLAQKAMILIEPTHLLGKVVWPA